MINEIIQSKLEILSQDELMITAIKYLIEKRIEQEKPIIERTDDDKLLGEKYRAYEKAKEVLKEFLTDIETYKVTKINKTEQNRAK